MMIHKLLVVCAFVFLIFTPVFGQNAVKNGGQNAILDSYERNFIRASLATKSGVLRDAAGDESASQFYGDLCEFALDFVFENGALMRDDNDMVSLLETAAKGASDARYENAVDILLSLFPLYRDSRSRVAILNALGTLGKGNADVITSLNQLLANQNYLVHSGLSTDYPSLRACLLALGAVGDASSFPVLFSAMESPYSKELKKSAEAALDSLAGSLGEDACLTFLTSVVKKDSVQEKLAALRLGVSAEEGISQGSGKLSDTAQAKLALAALQAGLAVPSGKSVDAQTADTLRFEAIQTLTRLEWTQAAPSAIKNFHRAQTDFDAGFTSKARLIAAIDCLGVMGSGEAAQALSIQLGLDNSRMEQTGKFDTDVTSALISALGDIGDKAAFDYLLYVSYLQYPDAIQSAARGALAKLKW